MPQSVELGSGVYPVHSDYRDILDILVTLEREKDPDTAAFMALHLFFVDFNAVPEILYSEAWQALCGFIRCGEAEGEHQGGKLLDWEQDAGLIVAEVNRVAGCEVRALPYMHWYTFMGHFGCIGEGQLATVVAIRRKRARGKKLDGWEREFYRENRQRVDFERRYTRKEEAHKQALLAKLRG